MHISADIGNLSINSSDSQPSSNLQNGVDTGQEKNTSAASKIQVCDSLGQNGQDSSQGSDGHGATSEAIAAKMKQTYNSVSSVGSRTQNSVKTKVLTPKGHSERTKVSSPRGQGQVSPRGQGQVSPRGQGQMMPGEKTVPTTSFQFQADYKSLKHSPEGFYNYLKV